MLTRVTIITVLACVSLLGMEACNPRQVAPKTSTTAPANPWYSRTDTTKLDVSDAEWKKVLTAEVYAIAREGETERPFTGKYVNEEAKGAYYCAVCGNHLFNARAKFSSTCGWPSFFESVRPAAVRYLEDNSIGMERTEVRCGRCDSHLGHVFDDGPPPTGKRFCMNGNVLDFEPFSDAE